MTGQRENTVGVIYLLLTALCWGFVASTVKQLTTEVDPYTIAFFRVSMATVVFSLLLRRKKWRRIGWLLPWVVLAALGRSGNYLLHNSGLARMPSNAATIVAPVQAISTVLLARWFVGERMRGKWTGLGLSVAGLVLIWWSGRGWATLLDPRYVGGNVLLVLAGLASALHFTSQKVLSAHFSGPEILLPVFALSTLITIPFAATAGGFTLAYSPSAWLLLFVLGLVLTGGSFFFLGEGFRRCDASTAVVITNTSTFLTLLWSALLMRERVSLIMIVGAVLGVAGTPAVVRADYRAIRQSPTVAQGDVPL